MKILISASLVTLLAACGQQYRYPCQDVTNWNSAECRKPLCEVHQQCPHHVLGSDSQNLVEEYRRNTQGKSR